MQGNTEAEYIASETTGKANLSTMLVYDGRTCIGSIVEGDAGCQAIDAGGRPLGRFAKRRDAARAISAAAGGAS